MPNEVRALVCACAMHACVNASEHMCALSHTHTHTQLVVTVAGDDEDHCGHSLPRFQEVSSQAQNLFIYDNVVNGKMKDGHDYQRHHQL